MAAEFGNPLDPSGSNPLGPTYKINQIGYLLSIFYSARDSQGLNLSVVPKMDGPNIVNN